MENVVHAINNLTLQLTRNDIITIISCISTVLTAIAAFIAVLVTLKISHKQNTIASMQNEISQKQAEIAEQQNKISLFEKRYEVFNAYQSFVSVWNPCMALVMKNDKLIDLNQFKKEMIRTWKIAYPNADCALIENIQDNENNTDILAVMQNSYTSTIFTLWEACFYSRAKKPI